MRSRCDAIVTILGMVVLGACGRSPATPTPTQSAASSAPPAVMEVLVTGPARLAPGATASCKAIANYSDGSSKDVTANATWLPSGPGNMTPPAYFTAPGVVQGANAGEIDLYATYGNKNGSLRVLVLPDGTYKLAGTVLESSGRPLWSVGIDVLAGTGTGLHAITNASGLYALYGVAGSVRVRASADGFASQMRDVVVTSDASADAFTLAPLETPADISGTWTMTLAPAAQCPAGFPDIARGRSYQVRFTQQGTGLKLDVSGPTLKVYNQGEDYGTVLGSQLQFILTGDTDYGDWSTADLVDQLSPTENLQLDGTIRGTIAGSQVVGATLDGDLVYYSAAPKGNFTPNWYCRAKNHPVTLQR